MNTEYLIGFILVAATVAAGLAASSMLPALGSVTAAILAGMLVGNLSPWPEKGKRGIKLCEKRLLNIAIALMGFELEFHAAAGLGGETILVIIGVIAFSITAGILFGALLPVPKRLALLLGIGNGVCGSAAIAAAAPLIEARQEEIGISIGIVNLLGAIAIFLLPFLARILKLDTVQSSLLIGGTVQAVGQTLATGLRMGEEIARLAVIVKMGRVLLLGAVLIALSLTFRTRNSGGFPIPPFIVAFVIFALTVNVFPLSPGLLSVIGTIKTALLLCAMAAIGMSIEFRSLARHGILALSAGAAIFSMNIALVLGAM
ncbi:putative sulfate exporter family transporter [Marispirochaeta sp.]|uniref:YeiH family protein n=1 Tax=Marispirochaeta sp. TaxID=2038653 RepID=UPI0029C878E4|nr:putative sulfate exporter family transporter [Marispirochaeta sp.]